jgi:hypothetical protein
VINRLPVAVRDGRLLRGARVAITGERLLVLALALAVLLVHDVGFVLDHPFRGDESWVAVTARFPLRALPQVTSSTPIGWALLLRLVPVGGQGMRLIPLAFAGASVAVAYVFVRRLGWRDARWAVLAGVVGSLAVLFAPAMLARNDLKQYTADAFFALLVFALTSRLEREWSRGSLVLLGCAVGGGMLFSHTVAFVGVAAFASLAVVAAFRREWRRLAEVAVVGAATVLVMAAVYLKFDARAVVPGLRDYWHNYFVPLHGIVHFLDIRFEEVGPVAGLGPAWVAVPLVAAGVVTMVRLGRPVTATTFVVLWLVMFLAASARRYPFLDKRTSTFLLVVTVVVAAVGVVGVAAALARWLRASGAVALAVVTAAVFVANASGGVRAHTIPTENVRDQASYVAAHAAPGDVILVNLNSNWGFAYYWPHGHPARTPSSAVLQDYVATFPDQPNVVIARDRSPAAITRVWRRAVALVRRHPGARIWLIRTHMFGSERRQWGRLLRSAGATVTQIGPTALLLVRLK